MQRTVLILCLLLLIAPAGCSNVTQEEQLAMATQTYTTAVNVLAAYRAEGAFTQAEGQMVEMYAKAGLDALYEWRAALVMGQSPQETILHLNNIMRELIVLQLKAKDYDAKRPKPSSKPTSQPAKLGRNQV